jgi:ADP-ribosylation factor-binding protein GGA
VLDRYEAFKRGDYAAAANPVPRELAGSSSTQVTSLIDFDDNTPSNAESQGGLGTVDELASVFGPSPSSDMVPQQQPNDLQQKLQQLQQLQQQIQQQLQQQQQQPAITQQQRTNPNPNLFAQLGMAGPGTSSPSVYSPQPTGNRSSHASSTPQAPLTQARTGSPMGLGTPPIQGALRLGSPAPNYLASSNTGSSSAGGVSALGGATNGRPASGLGLNPSMGMGMQPQPQVQPQQQIQPQVPVQGQGQGKDPFADLVGLF